MCGVFRDIKIDPMNSVVTVTQAFGEIVSSGIMVGSAAFAEAASAPPSTKDPKFSAADSDEAKQLLQWLRDNNVLENPVLFTPKPESVAAASGTCLSLGSILQRTFH